MATKKAAKKSSKAATKKSASSKVPAKKSPAKKSPAKRAAKKSASKKSTATASKSVGREMKAFKEGKLRSGSGQKVTNPKQAIAIGLSEARRDGASIPEKPS